MGSTLDTKHPVEKNHAKLAIHEQFFWNFGILAMMLLNLAVVLNLLYTQFIIFISNIYNTFNPVNFNIQLFYLFSTFL